MAMIDVLQETIDYMETHLLEPLTISEIAKQANLSNCTLKNSTYIQ